MIFNNFGFSHSQISKFWNEKNCCHQIWTCCLHLAEVKKRWILIKFWTGMIYGKIYDYFPTPNYSWTNWIFFWIFTCKNYFALGRTFQNLGKTLKIYLPSTPNVRRTRNRPVPGLRESSSGQGWYRRVEVQGWGRSWSQVLMVQGKCKAEGVP